LYFVFSELIMLFRRLLSGLPHSEAIRRAGNTAGRKDRKSRFKTAIRRHQDRADDEQFKQGSKPMARFEMMTSDMATMGGETRAETFCDMGLMYATGRGCPVDLVSAHKWLNIAAIKGSDRAAELRGDLAHTMTKMQLAAALRAAREWMTMH
jgi:TPR repeat protein